MDTRAKIRLFVDAPLGADQSILMNRDQANYLFNVMRLSVGAWVSVFNGTDGEWQAEVVEATKRKGILVARTQSRPQMDPPDLWLLFAPIKKARTDFIVEKATEMGAARICPVNTDYTNSDRIRQDRLQAHAVEAAEQLRRNLRATRGRTGKTNNCVGTTGPMTVACCFATKRKSAKSLPIWRMNRAINGPS